MSDNTTIVAIDWSAIEADYRAGLLPLRTMASKHGISEGYIRKQAKRYEWKRSLAERAAEAVRNEAVRKSVLMSAQRTDAEIVKEYAEQGAEVDQRHRREIERDAERDAKISEVLDRALARDPTLDLDLLAAVVGKASLLEAHVKLKAARGPAITLEREIRGLADAAANSPFNRPSSEQEKARIDSARQMMEWFQDMAAQKAALAHPVISRDNAVDLKVIEGGKG